MQPRGLAHPAAEYINKTTLAEALHSSFFRAFARRQLFNENLLAPCTFLDNPGALREIVAETAAGRTHPGAEESLVGETAEHLDALSGRWRELSRATDKKMRERRRMQ